MRRKVERLHFVGIGGIGMAALAELLHAEGYAITGSDIVDGVSVAHLRGLGIPVSIGHDGESIGAAQIVVRSSAIDFANPELAAARSMGLQVVDRGDLLAEVMRPRESIAIAGSHGKTTTSAMTSHVLEVAGLDPTALIGGRVPRNERPASPVRHGKSNLLVAEVDESDGSFLKARPVIGVITNIDPEHLDHYGDRDTLLGAFRQFANQVPFWGATLLGIDHPGVRELAPNVTARAITFGFDDQADYRIKNVDSIPGGQRAEIVLMNAGEVELDVPMPGQHNVLNALAALCVGIELGVAPDLAASALASFPGVSRRFERKGIAGGVEIIDDYAHHPAEIRAALAGARSIHPGPITVIFQPHRFTRTRDCWDEFLSCFGDADRVVLCDIYPASEGPIEGIDSDQLARAIKTAGHPAVEHGGSLAQIASHQPDQLREGELVLTMGAGDVVSLGPKLLAALDASRGANP